LLTSAKSAFENRTTVSISLPAASKLKETDAGIPSIWVDSMNSLGRLPFGVVAHTGASCRHGAACPLLAVMICDSLNPHSA